MTKNLKELILRLDMAGAHAHMSQYPEDMQTIIEARLVIGEVEEMVQESSRIMRLQMSMLLAVVDGMKIEGRGNCAANLEKQLQEISPELYAKFNDKKNVARRQTIIDEVLSAIRKRSN